jgi:hypothetical protein
MADVKIKRLECEKARLKAFFPKKSIPVWIVFALLIGLTVFCYNPMSAATADFIHEYVHIPYISITLPILEVIPITADVFVYMLYAIYAVAFILIVVTLIRFFLKKPSSKVEIIAFYISVGLMIIIMFLLYHNNFSMYTTPIETRMGFEKRTFTEEEKNDFAEIVIEQVNALSLQVPRDENGNIIVEKEDFQVYKDALRNISDIVPGLDGYYVTPKLRDDSLGMYIENSDLGVTEDMTHIVWYSDAQADVDFPVTITHETAHSQGYGKENEADFIADIACLYSDDIVLEYCAWLTICVELRTLSDPDSPIYDDTRFTDLCMFDRKSVRANLEKRIAEYQTREGLTDEEIRILIFGDDTADETAESEEAVSDPDDNPYYQDVYILMAYFEAYPERLAEITA